MNKGKLIQFLFLAMCCCALTTMGILLFYSIDDIELLRITDPALQRPRSWEL